MNEEYRQNLKNKILESVKAAQDAGWAIEQEVIVLGYTKICCALGSCEIDVCQEHDLSYIKDYFGLSSSEMWSFMRGFDGPNSSYYDKNFHNENDEYWNLGREIARELGLE